MSEPPVRPAAAPADARSGEGDSTRARRWLVLGALLGVALAAASLVHSGRSAAPAPEAGGDAVAWVDGEPISRETFARFVGAVARERGRLDLDPAGRRALLDRLVDEELLLREGLALGLARQEPNARRAIVSAVVDGITSRGTSDPGRATLEAFYARHRERWKRPGPVRVEAARVPLPPDATPAVESTARARAQELARRARGGEALPALAAELEQPPAAAPPDPPLPDGPIAVAALRGRWPEPVVEALLALQPGGVSDPVRGPRAFWVVRLVSRAPDEAPPLDAVLAEVRGAWLQQDHEERLRRHLDELRANADVRIELPDAGSAAAR